MTSKGAPTAMKKNLRKTITWMPQPQRPVLRFTPTAWAQLLFLRDAHDSEIGGFGLSAEGDLLLVEELRLVTQTCTATHVEFDDSSVADFFDAQVDVGRQPETFGRIWIHTHPGSSAVPSWTDELTFARAFGGSDWAVMFILARGGQSYARLRYNVGPGADVPLPVDIDYSRPFGSSQEAIWRAEYDRWVIAELPPLPKAVDLRQLPPVERSLTADWYDAWGDYTDPFDTPLETTHADRDEF